MCLLNIINNFNWWVCWLVSSTAEISRTREVEEVVFLQEVDYRSKRSTEQKLN